MLINNLTYWGQKSSHKSTFLALHILCIYDIFKMLINDTKYYIFIENRKYVL